MATVTVLHRAPAEIRRLRAECDTLRGELAKLRGLLAACVDAIDHETEIRMRRLWYRDGWDAGCKAGLAQRGEPERESLDVDPPGAWPVPSLGPLPRVDPDIDRLRYPPSGRRAFGQPRSGDYSGIGDGR